MELHGLSRVNLLNGIMRAERMPTTITTITTIITPLIHFPFPSPAPFSCSPSTASLLLLSCSPSPASLPLLLFSSFHGLCWAPNLR